MNTTERSLTPETRGNSIPVAKSAGLDIAFACIIAGFGALALCTTLNIVIQAYSPVPFWDQWEIIRSLMKTGNHVSVSQLWAPHNEHRILVGRLLCFADLFFFGGRSTSLLGAILLVQSGMCALLSTIIFRWSGLKWPVKAALCGLAVYCLFSPITIKDFVWPFQVVYIPVYLGAALTFTLAIQSKEPSLSPNKRSILFAACILGAAFTEATIANGLLVWPALLALLVLVSAPRRHLLVTMTAMFVGTVAYLWHFPEPVQTGAHATVTLTGLAKFVVTILAFSWDSGLPNRSQWPSFSESLSTLAIGFAIVFAYQRLSRRKATTKLEQFLFANLIFMLLTLCSIAVGRLKFGLDAATESRYQSFALIFWLCIAVVLTEKLAQRAQNLQRALMVFICLLLLAIPSRYPGMMAWALGQKVGLARGWNALMQSSPDNGAISGLYDDPTRLRLLFSYMRANHWGPKGLLLESARVVAQGPEQNVRGFSNASEACLGFVDGVTDTGGADLSVWGWAFDKTNASSRAEVAIVSSTGEILGKGQTGLSRPDVARSHAEFHADDTGWMARLTIPNKGMYYAYLLNESNGTSCGLNNSFTVDKR